MAAAYTVATESGSITLPMPDGNQKVDNIYVVPIVRSKSRSEMSYSSVVGTAEGERARNRNKFQ